MAHHLHPRRPLTVSFWQKYSNARVATLQTRPKPVSARNPRRAKNLKDYSAAMRSFLRPISEISSTTRAIKARKLSKLPLGRTRISFM